MNNYLKAGLIMAVGGGTLLYAHPRIQDPTQKIIIEVPLALVIAGGMIAAIRSRNRQDNHYPQERTHQYQTPQERDPRDRLPIARSQLHIHLTQDNRRYHIDLSTHHPHYFHPQRRDANPEPPAIDV